MNISFRCRSGIWTAAAFALAAQLTLQPPATAQSPQASPPAATLPSEPARLAQIPIAAPTTPAPVQSAPAAPQPAVEPAQLISLTLPRDLSPWGMFLAADIVVKAVMVGLAFASLLTWTIWFAKAIELLVARRRLRAVDRSSR